MCIPKENQNGTPFMIRARLSLSRTVLLRPHRGWAVLPSCPAAAVDPKLPVEAPLLLLLLLRDSSKAGLQLHREFRLPQESDQVGPSLHHRTAGSSKAAETNPTRSGGAVGTVSRCDAEEEEEEDARSYRSCAEEGTGRHRSGECRGRARGTARRRAGFRSFVVGSEEVWDRESNPGEPAGGTEVQAVRCASIRGSGEEEEADDHRSVEVAAEV